MAERTMQQIRNENVRKMVSLLRARQQGRALETARRKAQIRQARMRRSTPSSDAAGNEGGRTGAQ